MNWGTGIVLSLVAFAVLMGIMTFISMNEKVELVMPDYYKKELVLGEKMQRIRNAKEGEKVGIQYLADKREIEFQFPQKISKGKLYFFRASDSNLDFEEDIVTDQLGLMTLNAGSLKRGIWKISAEWKDTNEREYLDEQDFYIP